MKDTKTVSADYIKLHRLIKSFFSLQESPTIVIISALTNRRRIFCLRPIRIDSVAERAIEQMYGERVLGKDSFYCEKNVFLLVGSKVKENPK